MACLWDLTAKDPTTSPVVLRGHASMILAVIISPDNHWLVTGSRDGTARLWPLRVNDLIAWLALRLVEIFPLTNGGFIFQGKSTARPLTKGPEESVAPRTN
jgi:WD40 repeat protein